MKTIRIKPILEAFGVTHQQLMSGSREKDVSQARQAVAEYLVRRGMNTWQAGAFLRVDRSSISYHHRRFNELSDIYPQSIQRKLDTEIIPKLLQR